ncbi:MAG: site-specific integrase [Candidatus Electrothrix sp. AR5]|nr:site-specific integrase [Candidatus Electrothrix sp. AR5]
MPNSGASEPEFLSRFKWVPLDFANQYLDYSKIKFSPKTYNEKKIAFRMLFKSVDPELKVSEIHKGLVLSHLAHQSETRSGNAANKDRKNLVAAWNWAIQYMQGVPTENPFLVARFAEIRSVRHVPSEKDFWSVYNEAESEQDRVMLLCYLHLAARLSEIFKLRIEDVDLIRKRIRLYTRKRRDGSGHYDWLPLTERLHNELSIFMSNISREWLFPNPRTEHPYEFRQKWLPRLCKKAGVKPFGVHGIRHLSASILISADVSLIDVQTILRHQSLKTTERYIHRLDSVRKAVSVFK